MYTFTILFLSGFALFEVAYPQAIKKYKMVCAFICFSFLVFHDGFRWETGCDWNPYSYYFEHLISEYSIDEPVFEVGYYLFMLPIRLVTDNYTVYLIIHALFFYSAIFFFVFRFSTNPFVSILLLYMVTVTQMGTNRQFLAMAICLLGLYYLIKRERIIFVAITIVASFLHTSALLCFLLLFLTSRFKQLYLIIVLLLAVVVSLSGIVNDVAPYMAIFIKDDTLAYKFDYYTANATGYSFVSSLISLFRRLMWIIILMLFDNRIKNKPPYYYLFFNMYFLSTIMYVMFNGTVLQLFVSRGLLYFNIAEIMIIPYVLYLFAQNWGKFLVMTAIVAYVYISVFKGFANYGEDNDVFLPYKGLFINTDYERIDKG